MRKTIQATGEAGSEPSEHISAKTAKLTLAQRTAQHPCFGPGPCIYARVHLPVAPRCNIQCNYCVRKFDCFNESRPGVTSKILTADEGFKRYLMVKQHLKNLKVVGIAGPGDALANMEETTRTLKMIRSVDPDVTFCLSTNGLMLPYYAKKLIDLGVTHFTVTLNAVDVAIGAKIYKYINYFGRRYSGREAATILLANQLAGLKLLQNEAVATKINIVVLKGINDQHIPEVVRTVKSFGIYMTNIMPHIPISGSAFQDLQRPTGREINRLRDICEVDVRQMRHCRQCRADAVGTLDHDLSLSDLFACPMAGTRDTSSAIRSSAASEKNETLFPAVSKWRRFAVATSNGKIIDIHFGQAETFYIYESDGKTVRFIEKRSVRHYCDGPEDCGESKIDKWAGIFKIVSDCSGVLAMKIGPKPMTKLVQNGIQPIVTVDTVAHAVIEAAVQPSGTKQAEQEKLTDLL